MSGSVKKRVVFVCTGNTCRSPLAEGILRKLLSGESGSRLEVASAGVAASEGQHVSEFSGLVAAEHGIDLSGKRSHKLTSEIAGRADLIITMTSSHSAMVRATFEGAEERAVRLADLLAPDHECAGADVPDPFGGSIEDYRHVYRRIRLALEGALPEIERRLQLGPLSTDT